MDGHGNLLKMKQQTQAIGPLLFKLTHGGFDMNNEREDVRTRSIIGAAMEVHNQMGHGFLEAVYQESLGIEFALRNIPYERQASFAVRYKKHTISSLYRADFICYGDVLVELKALSAIGGNELSQVLNYLKASGLRLGLLLNFGASRLQIKRLVFDLHQPIAATLDGSVFENNPQILPMSPDKWCEEF